MTYHDQKRRGVFIDLAIGLGIPLVQVVFRMFLFILVVRVQNPSHVSRQNISCPVIDSTSMKESDAPHSHTTPLSHTPSLCSGL